MSQHVAGGPAQRHHRDDEISICTPAGVPWGLAISAVSPGSAKLQLGYSIAQHTVTDNGFKRTNKHNVLQNKGFCEMANPQGEQKLAPGDWPFLNNHLHNNELENMTLIGRVFVRHWETIQRPGGTPAIPGNGQTPGTGILPV